MKQEIPEFYGEISRRAAIRCEATLYRAAERLVYSITTWDRSIDNLRLVLSVLTSGGIWTLLSVSLPQTAAWFGAVFSTIVGGLASYQVTLGPKRKVKEAYALLRGVGRELAALRGHPEFDRVQFWEQYESFEFQLKKLENQRLTSRNLPSRWIGRRRPLRRKAVKR